MRLANILILKASSLNLQYVLKFLEMDIFCFGFLFCYIQNVCSFFELDIFQIQIIQTKRVRVQMLA